jgi:hypothetical protein
VRAAIEGLIRPALVRAVAPLAPENSDHISPEDWDRWLLAQLRPGIPEEAFKKTRSTLQGAFLSSGVLRAEGHPARRFFVQQGEPDALAWSWTLGAEIGATGTELDEAWALRASFAAGLFGTRVEYGQACIEAGIGAGLLRRSYLAGRPRLLLGEC